MDCAALYGRRRALGMSQGHLAGVAAVSRKTLGKAEQGGRLKPDAYARANVYLLAMERTHCDAMAALNL